MSGAFALRQLEGGIIAPVLGFGVDRLGPRRVIVAGGFVLGLGMIALSRSSSLWTFYVYFLFTAIGASALSHSITWPVVISRWFRRKRGRTLGISTSGPVLAGLPIMLTTWMVAEFGWRTVMLLAGLVIWTVIIPIGFAVRNAPEPYGLLPDGDVANEASSPGNGGLAGTKGLAYRSGYGVRAVLKDRVFWVVLLYFAILYLGVAAFSVHQIPYFESLGLSSSEAAFTVTIVFLVSAIGRLGSGWLSDLIDIRLLLAIVVVVNLGTWVYLITIDTSTLAKALPFTALLGITLGATFALRPVLMARLYGTRALGSISGLLLSGPVLTGMLGPLVMGRVFDVTGEYAKSIYVLALVAVLGLPLALMVRSKPAPV